MNIEIDVEKGRRAAPVLYQAFHTGGIQGHVQMPQDIIPKGMSKGSLEHLLFITLTAAIDYQRDKFALWSSSRKTYEDDETRHLFQPRDLYETELTTIIKDMMKHRLAQREEKDAGIWRTIGCTLWCKWKGNPLNFIEDCTYDAVIILKHLKDDQHLEGSKMVPDFPYLRGDKIGPLWVKMLRDNVGIDGLKNMDKVPIPVDIHISRASIALGVIKGEFEGRLSDLFDLIRQVWAESVKGLQVGEREMNALDLDEALWHLSKYGCFQRKSKGGGCPMGSSCEARHLCMEGQFKIEKDRVKLDTKMG